jgi:hypothetical protein
MADSSDDEFGGYDATEGSRYPVHDCVEFEDADSLRVSSGVRLWRPGGVGPLASRLPHRRCGGAAKGQGPFPENKQALYNSDTSYFSRFSFSNSATFTSLPGPINTIHFHTRYCGFNDFYICNTMPCIR